MHIRHSIVAAILALTGLGATAPAAEFTLPQALAYPFVSDLTRDASGSRIAWVRIVGGVRNIWVADAPGFVPRQVTQFTADDGQELTQLRFSPDGKLLVFVRGGDHDSNWPAKGNLQPNPTSDITEPHITLWRAGLKDGSKAAKITEGDAPALSSRGELAFVRDGQVWLTAMKLSGDGNDVRRAFFDRGKDSALVWSPDGKALAFVSDREDHSFIGVYTGADTPLTWLAPSTGFDGDPVWSPDGSRIAFTRQPGRGGPPESLIDYVPQPWSILTADVATGTAQRVWASGKGLRDSYPETLNGPNLHWAGTRLVFVSAADNWQHLYAVPTGGGAAQLLTPGAMMVEHVALSPDGGSIAYSANAGALVDDDDRRHLFRVPVDGSAAPVPVTAGASIEWEPVVTSGGIAFVGADAQRPPTVALADASGARRDLGNQTVAADFAGPQFVVPRKITYTAPDGQLIHAQLFEAAPAAAPRPGVVFVHGGPPRQMMLGWSYMRYYSNAYAMNQYLAAHGFTVLSVNYRLGIGYGFDFQHPAGGGWSGSSEYQDVLAGARVLQGLPGVDPARIGIWGGSYGGLLTALGLARNSDVFKAGVDIHGVHDWSREIGEIYGAGSTRFEKGDHDVALATAFKSSPVADVATWTSPVLFIHGDDDRNVRINQTIDLVRRLDAKGVAYEERIIPDEIHDFLRAGDWLTVDWATAEFLTRKLQP